ncbi:MAG: Undecaprenyl-phosphate galactose phosphotransferase [Planctomycetota bacterium]|nr:Undecaprenyl-phosphate galactose phosphotransferase [Planctomycetota bacterium]
MPLDSDLVETSSAKRAIDVTGSLLALVLLAPVFALVAALVQIGSSGPILFIQERTGRYGKPFRVFKFRTMTPSDTIAINKEATADDPRITRVGRMLRRTGLDELPQLVNVLRGEMSLIGPRPLLAWENQLCDERQSRRLLVRPGITGLSQINGRNAIPWADRIEWDVRYVDGPSLGLDARILLRTIPTALFGCNAYAPAPSGYSRPSADMGGTSAPGIAGC